MSLYPLRKTRKKPLLLENSCSWTRISNLQNNPLYAAYLQNGECETSAPTLDQQGLLKNPLKALVEEKYGISMKSLPTLGMLLFSSFIAFVLGSLPPMLESPSFQVTYRIPATVFIVALSFSSPAI